VARLLLNRGILKPEVSHAAADNDSGS
jgi:hypothetical protein